jgi:hypothetical protein
MLATPRAHDPSDANGHPTDQPQTRGEESEREMQRVVDPCSDEDLLMPASRAVSACFVFSHPAITPKRHPNRACRETGWIIPRKSGVAKENYRSRQMIVRE